MRLMTSALAGELSSRPPMPAMASRCLVARAKRILPLPWTFRAAAAT